MNELITASNINKIVIYFASMLRKIVNGKKCFWIRKKRVEKSGDNYKNYIYAKTI